VRADGDHALELGQRRARRGRLDLHLGAETDGVRVLAGVDAVDELGERTRRGGGGHLHRAPCVRVLVGADEDVVAAPQRAPGDVEITGAEERLGQGGQREVVLVGVARGEHDGNAHRVVGVALQRVARRHQGILDGGVLAAHHGAEHAVVDGLAVREHALVAHPVLVDLQVLAGAVAVRGVVARVEVQVRVAPGGAALADAARAAQEPDARLEAEVAGGQRADRAHVLGHQRVVVVELPPGGDDDLTQVAALAEGEHGILGQLVGDADAARADDAALGVVDDGRPEGHRLGLVHDLLVHALALALVLEPIVLQAALAGLVADGAVHRVVEEEQLLHRGARLGHVLGAVGQHLHARRARHLASGLELGLAGRHVVVLVRVPAEDIEHHRRPPRGR
jgi:hypothetical protein